MLQLDIGNQVLPPCSVVSALVTLDAIFSKSENKNTVRFMYIMQ